MMRCAGNLRPLWEGERHAAFMVASRRPRIRKSQAAGLGDHAFDDFAVDVS
jgi:hypothetical protein